MAIISAMSQEILFELRGEHIALCDLLKITGLANSGGHGKLLVASGEVMVDGQTELRKTAKIRSGQVVTVDGASIQVQTAAQSSDNA
jgi:ribosome-associated protein